MIGRSGGTPNRRLTGWLIAMLLLVGCAESAADPDHATPADAVQALLVGMIERDEAKVRGAILPDEKAPVLWSGEPADADQLQPYRQLLTEQTDYRLLEPGEAVELPGGEQHVLTEDVLSDDRQMVLAEREGRRIMAPLWVERTEAGWRVDAGPVIAAEMLRHLSQRQDGGATHEP